MYTVSLAKRCGLHLTHHIASPIFHVCSSPSFIGFAFGFAASPLFLPHEATKPFIMIPAVHTSPQSEIDKVHSRELSEVWLNLSEVRPNL